jgi:Sushi repeat (SCR repeat)
VEIKRINKIYEGRFKLNLNRKCHDVEPGKVYKFKMENGRRLHAIRLTIEPRYWDQPQLFDPLFSIRGRVTEWQNLTGNWINHGYVHFTVHSSILELTDDQKNVYFQRIELVSKAEIYICKIELMTYHDECGHPEVPLNGSVKWNLGNTEAIYRCDDGYQLSAPYDIRHCVRGKWNGSQPICEFH